MLPSKVLLLGWDETPPAAGAAHPSALTQASRLAPTLPLTVLVPYLPEVSPAIAHTRITGLGNLNPQRLATSRRRAGAWQAPAAPYAGAAAPPAPAAPETPAAAYSVAAPAGRLTLVAAGAGAPPAVAAPPVQPAEAGAEPGPAEAHDLSQPADKLTLEKEVAGEIAEAAAAEAAPAAAPATATDAGQQPLLQALAALRTESTADADLNFRVIQYARFAAPQAREQDFAVIYAADWPVWLAALEIRQLTGRPLVLHVHSLAADRNTPADRGWALELERLTLRRADLVLAATPAVAARLQAVYNLPAGRCRVVDPNDSHALHEVLNSFPPAD
ncbi:hypothetical protein GCM10022406_00660 [Hymenobacter algoricola]|uniref:Glycosyltransferase subfamily 4-like N-terminal domain-containing protein n=2 Tax=Hymenobacter algoricola TaxID=486267 RepID=A0ABP7M8Q0_9BACT